MIVDLTTQVDGARTVFDVGTWYEPGSLRVWRRGLLLGSGWTELGGTTLELDEAPAIGDRLQVRLRRVP